MVVKPLKLGELQEDALGRAVGVGVEGHRPHAFARRQRPDDLLGLLIDDEHPSSPESTRRTANLPSGVT